MKRKKTLVLRSGKESESPGGVRRRQSAELGALSAAGASSLSGLPVLGDLRGDVAVAPGNVVHLHAAASARHRVRHSEAAAGGAPGEEPRDAHGQVPSLSRAKTHHSRLQQMRELIAEHKPHIDKMNKTGPQLLELSPVEGVPIREKYTVTDQLYTKLKADVKQRAATLDEAISKSTQVRSDDSCCEGFLLTGYED